MPKIGLGTVSAQLVPARRVSAQFFSTQTATAPFATARCAVHSTLRAVACAVTNFALQYRHSIFADNYVVWTAISHGSWS